MWSEIGKRIALVCVSVMLSLLVVEGAVRLVEPRAVLREQFEAADPVLHHRLVPDARGRQKTMEFDAPYEINSLGLRNPANELHARMLLYFTGRSRESANIISDQIAAVRTDNAKSVESMHEIKRIAFEMKERLLTNDVDGVIELFRESWEAKKQMAHSISNASIDRIAQQAMDAGAQAVKISGAGGGDFMKIGRAHV